MVMHLIHISFVQKIFFLDHLRTMLHASLSLVEALDILGKEMTNKKFRRIVESIKQDVEKGTAFSEVLAAYPEIFPSMYVKMIESGEISGKLDESMEQIVIQMKKTHTLIGSIRSALMYPAVILVAMGGVGVMMATVVLPKLIEIFEDFETELPLSTRILIAVIKFLGNPVNLALLTASAIGAVGAVVILLKKSPSFKRTVHHINLWFPIMGRVIKQINLARFSLTLSSLMKSTVPIIDAVDITADTCTNMLYREALHAAAKSIKTGEALSTLLRATPKLFPPMTTEMIMVGERSGQIDRLLTDLSDFYGTEVDKTMKNFATVIEPIIIILLGVAIGGVAVAIVLPMYSLVEQF